MARSTRRLTPEEWRIERAAIREARLRDVEAALQSPIFAPYFPLIEANVLQNSTLIVPVRPSKDKLPAHRSRKDHSANLDG